MLNENFVYLGVLIGFIGGLQYFLATLKGQTKPNRVTFFFWALGPFVAFAAQLQKGVGIQSLVTFINGFNPALILIASFLNRKSYWKLTRFDIVCGLMSFAGLGLWILTREGDIAIFFAISADLIAGVPTIVKAYRAPETEHANLFFLSAAGALITLLTIKTPDFSHIAFPLYIFLICVLIAVLAKWKIGRRISGKTATIESRVG